jgi:hypothetical protein
MPIHFSDHPEFKPNYSPYEVMEQGSFLNQGGYWRPIYSRVLGKEIKNDYKKYGFRCSKDKLICDPDPSRNKYKTDAGLSLQYWENHGWIHPQDPRGWFEWYCNYYNGRRTEDDDRQIKRWLNVKKRFGSIKNKSNRVKQTLLQWAI